MPVYTLNGKLYNIPDAKAKKFESENPKATLSYVADPNLKPKKSAQPTKPAPEVPPAKTPQMSSVPQGFGDLNIQQAQFGAYGQTFPTVAPKEEGEVSGVQKISNALQGKDAEAAKKMGENARARIQQLRDYEDYKAETGKELKFPVLDETQLGIAPTIARDAQGNILRGENGQPLIGSVKNDVRAGVQRQIQSPDIPPEEQEIKKATDERNRLRAQVQELQKQLTTTDDNGNIVAASKEIRDQYEALKAAYDASESRLKELLMNPNRMREMESQTERRMQDIRQQEEAIAKRREEAESKLPFLYRMYETIGSHLRHPLGVFGYVGIGRTPKESDEFFGRRGKEFEEIYNEERAIRERKRMIQEGADLLNELKIEQQGGLGNLGLVTAGRNVWNKVTKGSTWDFGTSEANREFSIARAVMKLDTGQELTHNERALLDDWAFNTAVSSQYSEQLSGWAKASIVAGDSAPFMLEMALNPMSGLGPAATQTLTRYAAKKYGTKWVRNHIKSFTAAKMTARLTADIAGSVGMASTTGLARVAADATRRMTGEVDFDMDQNGDIIYQGIKADTTTNPAMAVLKAIGSTGIENWSEMAGNYLGFLNGYFGKVIGKAVVGKQGRRALETLGTVEGVSLNKAQKFIYELAAGKGIGAFSKGLADFAKRTQWHGVGGEYLEEVIGNIANATLVGDMTFDTQEGTGVFNLQQNIDTFCGVALMGGFMSALHTGGFIAHKRNYDVNKVNADNSKLFGDELWNDVRSMIDNSYTDPRELNNALTYLMRGESGASYSADEKKAILKYTQAILEKEGAEMADYQPNMASVSREERSGEDGKEWVVTSFDVNGGAITQRAFVTEEEAEAFEGELKMQQEKKDYNDFLSMSSKLSFQEASQAIDEYLATLGIDENSEEYDVILAELNNPDTQYGREFQQFKFNKVIEKARTSQAAIAAFEEENGWSPGTVKWLSEQDPMMLDEGGLQMADQARTFLEGLAYPSNEVHVEHEEKKGAEAAQSVVEEVVSTEVPIDPMDNVGNDIVSQWAAAQANRQEAFNKNEDLKQEVERMENMGLSPQEIVSSLDTFKSEEVQGVIDFYNAQARFQSFMNEASNKIEEEARNSRERHTFKGTIDGQADLSNVYTISDGTNQYYLVSGNVTTNSEDRITGSDSGLIIAMDMDGSFVQIRDTDGYSIDPVSQSLDQFEESERDRLQQEVTNAIDPEGKLNTSVEEGGTSNEEAPSNIEAQEQTPEEVNEPAPEVPQQVEIPIDEKTGVKLYEHGVPIEQAIADLNKDKVDPSKFADLAIGEAQAELDKMEEPKTRAELVNQNTKKKELQNIIDYYTALKEQYSRSNEAPLPTEPQQPEVPEWRDDTPQAARERGYKKIEGQIVERQEEKPMPHGMEVEVQYSTKDKAKGRLTVSELSDVQGSHLTNGQRNEKHFLPEAQPKAEFGTDRQLAAQTNANESNFRPELMLTFNGVQSAYSGSTSQTNRRGEVIQGNGRRNLAEYIYAPGNEAVARKYKDFLKAHAEELGTTAEAIEQMERPYAHIVLDVTDEEAIRLGQFTAADLESGGKRVPEVSTVTTKLGDKYSTLANIVLQHEDPDASLAERVDSNAEAAVKWLNQGGYINDTEAKTLLEDKNLARQFVKDLLTDQLFKGAHPDLRTMFYELPKNIQSAIISAVGREVGLSADKSILKDIQDSIRAYHELMVSSKQFAGIQGNDFEKRYAAATEAVNDWLRQINMDGSLNQGKFNNFALTLAKLYRSLKDQKTLAGRLREYYDLVSGATREIDMFGDGVAAGVQTKEDAIRQIFGIDYDGRQRTVPLAGDNQSSEEGRGDGSGSTESGEREPEGTRTADNRGGDSGNAREVGQEEIQPIGTGDFGEIYDQFRGKPKEAIDFLTKKKSGEALGALSHKDIGEIDLVWGEEGTGRSDGYGLAKLVKYHPEVLENLQEILDGMEVVKRTENRINLESTQYKAAVRLTWNEQSKTWLLTVFEKKNSALDNTTDTGKTSDRGKRNDTATPQSTVFEGKGTENPETNQEKSEEKAKINTSDPMAAIEQAAQGYELTLEDLEASDLEESVKSGARAWLKGDKSPINQLSFLAAQDYVRNFNGNHERGSQDADGTQLGGKDNGDRRPGGTGLQGRPGERLDSGNDEAGLSERGSGGENRQGDVASSNGTGSDRGVSGGEPLRDDSSESDGAVAGSVHRKKRGNGGRGGRDSGSTVSGRNVGGEKSSSAREDFDEALQEFLDVLAEDLTSPVKGKLLAIDPISLYTFLGAAKTIKVIAAGTKLAYQAIRIGYYEFKDWFDIMRSKLGDPLRTVAMNDEQIDGFIEMLWDSDVTIDGVTHKVREWATLMSEEKLREQMKMTIEQKAKIQKDAESTPTILEDISNIRESLPFLLPKQQEDVQKAEKQFFNESRADARHGHGKGMMFTNGTGTGKTYTGLGIAKRFLKQGKGRILIVTASDKKIKDWIKDAKNLGIEATQLPDTKTKGSGVVVTQYANMRQNRALLEDEFDLIIYDESHKIMENQDGMPTSTSDAHHMLSNRDVRQAARRELMGGEFGKQVYEAREERELLSQAMNLPTDEWTPEVREAYEKAGGTSESVEKRSEEIRELLERLEDVVEGKIDELLASPEKRNGFEESVKKTKVAFLSATPFNTPANLDYAEGYIFSYTNTDDVVKESVRFGQRDDFLMKNFNASHARSSKGKRGVTRMAQERIPDPQRASEEEVAFSDMLQNELGTMSGRDLDSEFDYSREFPQMDFPMAAVFNNAIQSLTDGRFNPLREFFDHLLDDYNTMTGYLEIFKAQMIAPRIREYLELGKKVSLYHRRKASNSDMYPPFDYAMQKALQKDSDLAETVRAFRETFSELFKWESSIDYMFPQDSILRGFMTDAEKESYEKSLESWKEQNTGRLQELQGEILTLNLELTDAIAKEDNRKKKSLLDQIRSKNKEVEKIMGKRPKPKSAAVVVYNGSETKGARDAAVDKFNDDNSTTTVFVAQVQSAKEGISLHDTTGKFPRVQIGIFLPQSPIEFIQTEGRIFRVGNKSNAIFEYPLLGLDIELSNFAQKINGRSATTENLALGSRGRGLRESISRSVLASRSISPKDTKGIGGKELDSKKAQESDDFDTAMQNYAEWRQSEKPSDINEVEVPDPIGYIMSMLGRCENGERVLVPNARRGSVARYVPGKSRLTAMEIRNSEFARLSALVGGSGRKILNESFADHARVNKYDVVVMNTGHGKYESDGQLDFSDSNTTSLDARDVVKACKHIDDSGRVVALVDSSKVDEMKVGARREGCVLVGEVKLPAFVLGDTPSSIVVFDKILNKDKRDAVGSPTTTDLSAAQSEDALFAQIRNTPLPDRHIDEEGRIERKLRSLITPFEKTGLVGKSKNYRTRKMEADISAEWGRFRVKFNNNKMAWRKSDGTWRSFIIEYNEIVKNNTSYIQYLAREWSQINHFLSLGDEDFMKEYGWYITYRTETLDADAMRDCLRLMAQAIELALNKTPMQLSNLAQGKVENEVSGSYDLNGFRQVFDSLNAGNAELESLADRVFDSVSNIDGLRFVVRPGETFQSGGGHNVVAHYVPSRNIIELNGNVFNSIRYKDEFKAQTIVHEMIHALTSWAIEMYNNEATRGNLTPEQQEACKIIKDVFSQINNDDFRRQLRLNSKVEDNAEYGLSNEHEMMAELSNPVFRAALKAKKLWNQLVNGVKMLLGIQIPGVESTETDALTALDNALETLMNTYDPDLYKAFTGNYNAETRNMETADPIQAIENAAESWREDRRFDEDENASEKPHLTHHKSRIAKHIAALAKKLGTQNRTTVYTSFDELPAEMKEHIRKRERQGRKVRGWYENGQVYLYLPHIDSVYQAEKTIWHETVAHLGLRELVGRENLNKLLRKLWLTHKDGDMGKWVTERMQTNGWSLNEAIEEYLAREAEKNPFKEYGLWQRLKWMLAEVLHRMGFTSDPTVSDVQYLFWVSQNRLRKNDPMAMIAQQAFRFNLEREAENAPFVNMNAKTVKDIYKQQTEAEAADADKRLNSMTNAVFVSNALSAVTKIKQEKATPEQWLAMIQKNGGLKAGEDKWLGLSEWLKGSDAKTMTKQEVLDFIRENQVQVEEVEYGGEDAIFTPNSIKNLESELQRGGYNPNNVENTEWILDEWDKAFNDSKLFEYQNGYFDIDENGKIILSDKAKIGGEINSTRLEYTTGGLENKREIALTVPTIESWNTGDDVHFGDAGDGRAVAWIRFGETTTKRPLTEEEIAEMPKADQWEKVDGSNFVTKRDVYFAPGTRNQQGHDYIVDKNGKFVVELGNARSLLVIPFAKEGYNSLEEAVNEYNKWKASKTKKTERVLVIDEIQSKRHQEGREKGYKDNSKDKAMSDYTALLYEKYGPQFNVKMTEEEHAEYSRLQRERMQEEKSERVPDAPFEKNWHELAMKRMLRYAAENGYDKVAWTKGEQQAERYDLSRTVSKIKSSTKDNGEKRIDIEAGGVLTAIIVNQDGTIVFGSQWKGRPLSDVVGKELATKLMKDDVELSGDGLRIGGEGMKGFYDQMLPRFMDKYGKPWGVKTQDITLPNIGDSGLSMHSVDVTPQMKESVMEGQPMFDEDIIDPVAYSAKDVYNRLVDTAKFVTTEAWQDAMLGLKVIQNAITKYKDILDSQNAYQAENLMHGKNEVQVEAFNSTIYDPLMDVIHRVMKKTGLSFYDIDRYTLAKSGLERNREFFVRDFVEKRKKAREKAYKRAVRIVRANHYLSKKITEDEMNEQLKRLKDNFDKYNKRLDKKLDGWLALKDSYKTMSFPEYMEALASYIRKNFGKNYDPSKHDYSGFRAMFGEDFNDADVIDEVMNTEDQMGEDLQGELWERINAASRYGLERYREAGMRSDEEIDKIEKMFHWYVPMRGFKEDTGEDMYQYFTSRSVGVHQSGSLLKHAKGRSSEAYSPIISLINMSHKAILDCNQNWVNQKFYRLCQANPNDAVVLSDSWVELDKNTDTWVQSYPQIPIDATEEQVRSITKSWDEEMKRKESEGTAKRLKGKPNFDYRPASEKKRAEHTVEVFINGQRKLMTVVGNPRAAQALNGMTRFRKSDLWISDWNAAAKNWMARMSTSYSPTFAARNMSRDWTHFEMILNVREGAGYRRAASGYYHPSRMKKLFDKYRAGTLNLSVEEERDFKDFMDNGGVTGFVHLLKVEDLKKEFEKELKKLDSGKVVKFSVSTLGKLKDAVEAYNEAIENAARFATYRASRHYAGRTRERSAYDAKEVTVNFNRKGAGAQTAGFVSSNKNVMRRAKWMGRTAQLLLEGRMFFNASLQGVATIFKGFKNPDGSYNWKYIRRFAMGYALPPFALSQLVALANQALFALFGGDDDDNPYANLPEWTRRKNVCIWLGWVPGMENTKLSGFFKDGFLTIPIGIELAAFYSLGDVFAGMTFAPELKSVDATLTDELLSFLNTFSPVDFETKLTEKEGVGGVLPRVTGLVSTVAAPMVAIGENLSWTGRKIFREDKWKNDEHIPEYQMAYSNTKRGFVLISEGLSRISGGDGIERGYIEINPGTMQYLTEQYLGGPGKLATNTGSLISDLWDVAFNEGKNANFNIRKVEVVKGFFTQADENQKFYRTKAKLRKYEKESDKYGDLLKRYGEKAGENPDYMMKYVNMSKGVDYARHLIIKANQRTSKIDGMISLKDHYKYVMGLEGDERKAALEVYNKRVSDLVKQLDDVEAMQRISDIIE